MFCSLIPRLFLVKGENKPGYKAKYFVCVMVVGVGLRVTLREKNVVSCRIAASAVSHCEANILTIRHCFPVFNTAALHTDPPVALWK